jgi:hypothetical protein
VRTTCGTLAAALTLSLCACAISSKQQLATLHELLELIKKRTAQMSSASAEYKPKLRRIPQPDGYDLVETIGAEVQALWQMVENLNSAGAQIAPMIKLIENLIWNRGPASAPIAPTLWNELRKSKLKSISRSKRLLRGWQI